MHRHPEQTNPKHETLNPKPIISSHRSESERLRVAKIRSAEPLLPGASRGLEFPKASHAPANRGDMSYSKPSQCTGDSKKSDQRTSESLPVRPPKINRIYSERRTCRKSCPRPHDPGLR